MDFFNRLVAETETERVGLLSAPIIARCFNGDIDVDDYVAFLTQAYHHVRHTVPLMMAVGARLPPDQEWLREAVAEYIEEEIGHQEWILNDIAACGFDKEAVRHSTPAVETELMVAYAYDTINRVNPLGFFGMVHVLEGTSTKLAEQVADIVSKTLQLPKQAFSYLYSHGALDQEHVAFFARLMNRIENPADQNQIIHSCNVFYRLYGNIFRALDGVPRVQPRLRSVSS